MAQVYSTSQIRNIVLAGHTHGGKTSLVAALLHAAGATPRLLKVDEGNTITDFDEEEIARRISISSAFAACEWKRTKVNLVDTPGFNIFLHDTRAAMMAADAVAIIVDGLSGIGVSTHKVWKFAEELQLPVFFVVTKLDRDRASFDNAVRGIEAAWGHLAVPTQLPIMAGSSFQGVTDLVRMTNIGDGMADEAQLAHEALVEAVAEGEDELMEEFFATGTIGVEHIVSGLKEEMQHRRIFPILCASGISEVGAREMLDFIVECVLPSNLSEGSGVSLQVVKTSSDPAAGRSTYFRVMSGTLRDDAHLLNLRTKGEERLAHLSVPIGKTQAPASELHAGDVGVVSRLRDTLTFDTLTANAGATEFERPAVPEPAIAYAISTRTGDDNRLSAGLTKLLEEDLALRFYRDEMTHEFLLAGNGQQHVEIAVSRLKKRYHVDVELKAPKIPYRETIRSAATAQGRHKKQSGGHGQFGDCHIRIEPLERGEGFTFVNEIFGGAIPRQFIPAVEKGIVEAASQGFVSGHPVVDFKVTLLDGSYHDVDSSEMAFKLAGRKAFRAAMENAKPVLLEPVMRVDVESPGEFAGDLMSDFSSRRGRISGTDLESGSQVIHAQVPMSEMLNYAETLTARTQGRGSFHMEFDHYDVVPTAQAQRIIENARSRNHTGDDE